MRLRDAMKKKFFRLLFLFALAVPVLPAFGAADQRAVGLKDARDAAIAAQDYAVAAEQADLLFNHLKKTSGDTAETADAAYAAGKLLEIQKAYGDAAARFKACAEIYTKLSGVAQQVDCRYLQANALALSGKTASAIDVLERALKTLEDVGQAQSGIAGKVLLRLANLTEPEVTMRKLEAKPYYSRMDEYAARAQVVFENMGEPAELALAQAFELRGVAQEGLEEFEASAVYFESAIDILEGRGDADAELITYLRSRLIVVSGRRDAQADALTISAKTTSSEQIQLEVKKRGGFKIPRVNRSFSYRRAFIILRISIGEDYRPTSIEVVESFPEGFLDEVTLKAVKRWSFIPPDGIDPSSIEPFTYTLSFNVVRRN